MRRTALPSFLLTALLSSLAVAAPQESRVPGGIAILPVPAGLSTDVRASLDGHAVLVEKAADGCLLYTSPSPRD